MTNRRSPTLRAALRGFAELRVCYAVLEMEQAFRAVVSALDGELADDDGVRVLRDLQKLLSVAYQLEATAKQWAHAARERADGGDTKPQPISCTT